MQRNVPYTFLIYIHSDTDEIINAEHDISKSKTNVFLRKIFVKYEK